MKNVLVRQNNTGNRWLDPMFEDFFSVPSIFDRRTDRFVPKVNIIESENHLQLTFEIPGIEKDDIKLSITDRILTVSGKRENRMKSENELLIREEIFTGQFERQFTLPDSVKTNNIQAEYKDGILTISLEKKEEVKPKQIDVKIK